MSDIGSWFSRKAGASPSRDSQPSATKPRRRRSGIMLLEPRMMYDGAGAATAAHHHHHHDAGADHGAPAATGAASESNTATGTPSPAAGNGSGTDQHGHGGTNSGEPRAHVVTWVKDPTEIVFIDAQVPDAQVLAQGAKPGVEVVMLDANGDGVKQIADFLARHPDPNLTTIDIVAHGADGMIQLGNTILSSSNIGYYESQLAAIGNAMKSGGTIQIFGCDVAQDATGDIFLAQLSAATGGANIDGSSHLVGAASKGGSWTLNVQLNGGHGSAAAATTPFTDAALASYADVLPDQIFITSTSTAGSEVTSDNTGTANNSASLTVTGTLIDPTYIAVDAAHGVFYVVDFEHAGSTASEQAIYVGAINGTLADGHKVDKIFSTPAADNNLFGGIALDATTNTLYFAQGGLNEYDPNNPNAHTLDQINGIFSLNLNNLNLSSVSGPGTLSETLVAYGPNLGIFMDIAVDPVNHKVYFIDDSTGADKNTFAGNPNTSATNDIYVASTTGGPNLATSILHLASSDSLNGVTPVGYTQGFLSGIALDVTNQTLYFSTWDQNYSISTGAAGTDNVYKASVSALGTTITGANVSTALLYSTASVGQPSELKVDVSSGQLFILNRATTSSGSGSEQGSVLVGSVNGGTVTKIFQPAQSTTGDPVITNLALDAAPVLTASGATTTYTEGSSADHFETSAGITTLSDPGELLTGATVQIGAGFDANHDSLNFSAQNGITGIYSASTGLLTLSGLASASAYATAIDSVTFSTNSTSATQRAISFTVTDSVVTSNSVTDHVNVNVPPTFGSVGNTAQFYQSTGNPVLLDSAIAVTDASNISSATVTIGSAASGDTLTINGTTSGTIGAITYSFSGATLTLTGSDSAAHYAAALAAVTYGFTGDPTIGGTDKVRTISWSVTDVNGLSSAGGASTTLDVYATPVVVIGANSPTPTVTSTSGPVVADPGLTITDNNGSNFATAASNATVVISGGFQTGDTLSDNGVSNGGLVTGTNIHASYDSTTHTLTLSGADSAANYKTALEEVQFNVAGTNAGTRTLTWQINDQAGGHTNASVAVTSTVDAAFVNQAPTATVPGTNYGATEQVNLSLKGTGLSVGDVDGGSGIETVTLSVGEGILTGSAGGSGISIVSGNGTSSLVISGTIAQLNAFLGAGGASTLVYNDNTDTPSASTTLTLAINDGGNTGTGSPQSASASATIDITAVNDAPVASVPGGPYSATEQTSLDLKNTGLSVGDVDSLGGSETVTLSVTEGTLTVAAGTSGATVSNSGTSTVTITGTISEINALLNSDASSAVSYIDGSDNPSASATLTLGINDNGNTGTGSAQSGSASVAIDITAVNDAPTASAPGTHYGATEQVDLSLKGTGLSVGDVDGGSGIETVTLSVGEGILTGSAGGSGISIVSGNGTSSLVISGTIAQLNAFLGAGGASTLVYNDNTDTPSASTTLTLAINDGGNTGGGALTASASATIDITAVNDAPVASVPGGPYSATEQTSLDLKNTGLSVGDVDGLGGSETVTLSVTEGTLTVAAGTSGATVSNSGTSTVTITGTISEINALLNSDASSAVSYIDGSDNPSASATLTLGINDNGHTGTPGAQTGTASATIDITAVNDAPTASAPGTHYGATEQVDLSLKGTGLSVGDVDGGSGIETVTLSVGEGVLTGSAGGSGISIVSGNGTSSLVISGTIAQLNAFLGAGGASTLVYNDNTDTPSASTTLTLAINDGGNTGGGALTASASATIDITAVNDAPVASVPGGPYSATEQSSLDLKNTGLSVGDVDGLGGSETVTLSVTEGTLTVAAGTSGATVSNSGTSTVTITGTISEINALLNSDASSAVSYIDGSDNPSASATLTLGINDNGNTGTGSAQSGSASVAIDITAVNDAPTASAPGTHYGATEQVDLSLKGTGLSVGDVDGGSGIETVTLSVGEGILTGSAGGSGISIVSGNGTSSLVISGTIAQLNAFLGAGGASTLVYNDNTDTPSASTTLTLAINDGGNTGGGALTASASATIDITAVNDAPVASVPGGPYSATEQSSLDLKNTGLSVGDVDSLGGSETVTLSVTEGTLTVAAGTSGATVSNSGTSTVTITGTISEINALLNSDASSAVSYIDGSDNPSASATLTLGINDNGNTGTGSAQSGTASATIDITAVNDAPTASAPGTHYGATEQVDLSLKGTGLSVGDVDGGSGIETVTLSVGEGVLTGSAGGSGISIVSGNGTSSLVISGTIAQLNAFLGAGGASTLVYNDNTDTPSASTTLTLAINDGGNTGGGALTASASATIDITAVNDAPTASAPGTHYAATEQVVLSLKNTGLSVNDVDSLGGIETATLSVTEGTLTVTSGTSGASVSGSGTSTVTITGTISEINALLATDGASTVSYIDNTDTPSASATLTLAVNDNGNTGTGGAQTGSASATIDITAVNDAPTASAPGIHYGATEQVDLSLKGTGLSVGDVDGGSGIETVTLSAGEGILTGAAGDSGISIVGGNGTSSLVVSGTIAQLNAFLGAGGTSTLVYNDNTDTPSASTTLTLAINDGGNTGTGGALSASASATIDIKAVNDAPTASAPGTHYAATEQVVLSLKNTGLSVNDVDSLGGIETATLSVTEGTLTVTSGTSGASVSGSGTSTVTITGSIKEIDALLNTDGTSAVSYVDTNHNPSPSATLTLAINDNGNTGTGGAKTASASATIDITGVNDAPTASVPGAHYSATEQVNLSLKNTGLSVGDVDGRTGIETVTLSVGEGILTGAVGDSGVSIVSGNGTSSLVVSGTIAQLNAFLGAGGTSTLVYNDNTDTPATSTTLTLAVNDNGHTGTGGALSASASTTIDIIAVNDPPVITAGNTLHYDANNGSAVPLDAAVTVSDVDSGHLTGASVAITGNFAAGDKLNFVNQFGITGSYNTTTGVLTLTGADTLAHYQQALASITFSSTTQKNDPKTVTWTVTDLDETSPNHATTPLDATSATTTTTIDIRGRLVPPPHHGDDDHHGDRGHGDDDHGHDGAFGMVTSVTGGGFFFTPASTIYVSHADIQVALGPNDNFDLQVPLLALASALDGDVVAIDARLPDGRPLPDWLHFDGGTGKLAGLPPADIETGSISPDDGTGAPTKPGTGGPAFKLGDTKLTVEIVGWSSKGDMSILTVTIDLAPGKNGTGLDQPQRHGWLGPRDAGHRVGGLESARPHLAAGALDGAAGARAVPAGRAGLTAQLNGAGWRAMHADRMALLQSVSDSARRWR
ncbi:DUF4347 domain-containing protein [Bradyrhizobium guangzhouense]|uniref:DUF4347 domain-containing protein n=1 Tax=Bradyrhizobium guangzhouense TaxID=1325095 RepID=A0AAE5WZY4_9BRAD|nr:DUF4347 domain-containing protein [Bradyrhizobium guangzhouense]QAU46357.1 hypothetical protein XH91_13960 [Bradyrhizobium guangzhouense]